MNDLIFIRETIKQLKREYGSILIIGKTTVNSQNPETGVKDVTTNQITVRRAIRLPNQISFDFLKTIAGVKGSEVKVGNFTILIDKQDIPVDYPVVSIDYAEYAKKRLDIIKVDDFEHALILHVQEISGAPVVGIRRSVGDMFPINSNSVNQ